MISTSIAIAMVILASVASAGTATTVVLLSWLREEHYRSEHLEDRLAATTESLNSEVRRESLTLQGLLARFMKPVSDERVGSPRD